jgi:hypothetical protein
MERKQHGDGKQGQYALDRRLALACAPPSGAIRKGLYIRRRYVFRRSLGARFGEAIVPLQDDTDARSLRDILLLMDRCYRREAKGHGHFKDHMPLSTSLWLTVTGVGRIYKLPVPAGGPPLSLSLVLGLTCCTILLIVAVLALGLFVSLKRRQSDDLPMQDKPQQN